MAFSYVDGVCVRIMVRDRTSSPKHIGDTRRISPSAG
jgi:hypothetical protein